MFHENLSAHLDSVCRKFRIEGEFVDFETVTVGNINDTYKVIYRKGMEKSYILQKINTYVFKNPRQIMSNIDFVTSHIRAKNTGRPSLHFYHTVSRDNFYRDEDCYWRLCNYIDSVTYNLCKDPAVLYGAGHAFGEFQMQLSDLNASLLYETIPDFHNTAKRLEKFFSDVNRDIYGRAHSVRSEIEYIRSMRETACALSDMLEQKEISLCVTHNDTKTNNVLFDKVTYKPLTVIDLDTVMPGLAMHDFGDAVRSAANTAAEDERDLDKVSLDLGLFRAFAEGYIPQVAGSLSEREIDSMALGALTITIELALRFLDDYLTGDKYFKVNYEGHNADRARCQLKLARDMQTKFTEMNGIIKEISGMTGQKTMYFINFAQQNIG